MKHLRNYASIFSAALLFSLASGAVAQEKAAAFRRFTTTDGKSFYAVVTEKSNTSVTFKLQNGKPHTVPTRLLSEPDKLFVLKWTKFKDDLLNNSEFATLTVKELLELKGYQSFEFDIDGNHIFVDAELAGKPVRLMIDTGADSSLIDTAAAKGANLQMGPFDQKIRGVAGEQEAAVTKVSVLKLGDAAIENRKILATNFEKIGGGPGKFDLIFGADFLRELDAVINYKEGRMFLMTDNIPKKPEAPKTEGSKAEFRRWTAADGKSFVGGLVDKTETEASFRLQNGQIAKQPIDKFSEADQDLIKKWSKLRDELAKDPRWKQMTVKELLELRAYQSFQYRMESNHILVDGLIGTTKTRFLIDTGAYSCVMDLKYAKEVAKLEVGPMDRVIQGIGGTAPAAETKIPEIKLGDAIIRTRLALSAEIHKGALGGEGNHDALFGAEFLRELDAVISYKENRMFLKPDNSDRGEVDAKPAEPKKEEPKKEAEKKEK